MSTLGEVLAQLHDRSEVYALLAEAGDIAMISRLNDAAEVRAQDPCDVALDAVEAFTARADEAAWVRLMGRLRDAHSPGAVCLSEMISWSLAQ